MAQLRELLVDAGYLDVATHGQSGNVVLGSEPGDEAALAVRVRGLIDARYGFSVAVTVRTAAQLAAVCAHDPIAGASADPKRYQVTFLDRPPSPEALDRLGALASRGERLAAHGRELYSHHPEGIARSKLAARLTHAELGETATVRNWTTVRKLGELTASS